MDKEIKMLELAMRAGSREEPLVKRIVGLMENINGEIDRLEKEDQHTSLNSLEGKSYSYAHYLFQNRMQKYLVLRTAIHRTIAQWMETHRQDLLEHR